MRLGAKPPVIRTRENDIFIFHKKEVVLLDLLLTGVFEEKQTEILKKMTPVGGVFIDIGANIGYYSLCAARWVGHRGKVYSFEPIPSTLKRLESNIELNKRSNVFIYSWACSSINGERKMVTGKDSGWSRLEYCDEGDTLVKVITLDTFVESIKLSRIDVIKIDTEGADFEVLKGAKKVD